MVQLDLPFRLSDALENRNGDLVVTNQPLKARDAGRFVN
jgi:hypothetical protein